ncbi:MAG: DUF4173 domain-containing protein [Oscillospiraceae bacterium]|nr:DUF4173 domain-containing protein [Oscillospiraceae bacterium]
MDNLIENPQEINKQPEIGTQNAQQEDTPEAAQAPDPLHPQPVYASSRLLREYKAADRWAVWACLGLGYLFIVWFLPGQGGIGATLFTWLFVAAGLGYCRHIGKPVTAAGYFWAGVTVVFALPPALYESGPLRIVNLLFLMLSGPLFVLICAGRHREWVWNRLPVDLIKTVLGRSFENFDAGFGAAASCSQSLPKSKKIGWALLGLLITVPLMAVIWTLLAQADDLFAGLTENVFGWLGQLFKQDFGTYFIRCVFSIPIALFFFGMLYGTAHPKDKQTGEKEPYAGVSTVLLLSAGLPVCLLYLVFFISQAPYYISAFADLLPAGYTYAGYARQGFFQLCAVAGINLGIVMLIRLIGRWTRKGDRRPLVKPLRIYTAVLCGFTLLLIATALRKMLMYIDIHGLTTLRVYTSWFMLLLALIFAVVLAGQWLTKLRTVRWVAAVFLIMFALLQFIHVDGWIAGYNYDRYRAGSLETTDPLLLDTGELGDAAIPYAALLLDDADFTAASKARNFLSAREREFEDVMEYNLTSGRAHSILQELAAEGKIMALAGYPEYSSVFIDGAGTSDLQYDGTVFRLYGVIWEYAALKGEQIGVSYGDYICALNGYDPGEWIAKYSYVPTDGGVFLYKADGVWDVPPELEGYREPIFYDR